MTARPDTSSGEGAPALPEPPRPVTAVVVAAAGALLMASAPLVGVVTPQTPPAFGSWPLLLVLAALPPVVAALSRHRPRLASAVLLAPAALAPGRALIDAQLIANPVRAARPELLLPDSIAGLRASTGLWLLLAGHLATLVAGILALRQRPADSGTAAFAEHTPTPARPRMLALVLCTTIMAALGILMVPFTSDDPFLLPHAALDSPTLVLVGNLLLALAALGAGGYVTAAGDPAFARGGLLGLGATLAAIVVPSLVAATVVADLHYGWGAWLALVAAVLVALLAIPVGRSTERPTSEEPALPALARLLTISAGLALAAGLLAGSAAFVPQLQLAEWLRDPSAYPARMLIPAAIMLILLGIGLLVPRIAVVVRPVLSVAWTVVPLAAVAVLDAVFSATQAGGLTGLAGLPGTGPQPGPGAWISGGAVFLALFAAVAAALGGAVERDDVDLMEVTPHRIAAVPAWLAAALGVAAFGLPVLTAPGYVPPGVFSAFGTASWGLVLGMLAVVTAGVIAPRCRPSRAVGLLCGAALVVLQRALELPLTSGRFEGSAAGPGLWAALACMVMLLIAVAVTSARPTTGNPTGATEIPEPGIPDPGNS